MNMSVMIAQKNFISSVKFMDNGHLDSIIRAKINDLGDSYYIIVFDILMSHTTLDPQIIEELNRIRKIRQCNEKVLFLVQNYDQIPDTIMKEYLTKSFNLTEDEWSFIHYFIDNQMASSLCIILPKVYYIFNRKLVYQTTLKRHNITDVYLPHHQFTIQELPDVELQVPDSIRIKTDDNYISPYKQGRILVSTDPQSAIYSVNINTGKFEKGIMAPNYEQTADYYCRVIAKGDSFLCKYARNFAKRSNLKERKRQMFDFQWAYYSGNHIYAYADIQAFHPNPVERKLTDEENKPMIQKKEMPMLDLWLGIAKLDTNFKIQNYSLFTDKQYPPAPESFVMADCGFFYNESDSSFISVNSIMEPSPPTFNVPLFSQYQKHTSDYVFKKDFPLKLTKKLNRPFDVIPGEFYFKRWQGKLISTVYPSEFIYDVENGKIIDTLEGDGSPPYKKESLPKFLEDTVPFRLNYFVNYMNTILNDEYLVITYFYKGRLLCEIKDKNFKTVDLFDLSRMKGFEKFILSYRGNYKISLCIHDDCIVFFTIENNKYIIKKFKIELCRKAG